MINKLFKRVELLVGIMLGIIVFAGQSTCTPEKSAPEQIPNLLTFWDFQEEAGSSKKAVGKFNYELREMNGPIQRVEDGIFGKYSCDFEWGQWFRIKHKDAPGLDLYGIDQQVSMVAWVKRESDRHWQFIAGMWDEGEEKYRGKTSGHGNGAPARQYSMFINGYWQSDYTTYKRIRADNQVHGYVSITGGASPGQPFAFDYASGKTKMEKDRWYMIAYTYDGTVIKVYVDDKLDSNENYNPFYYDKGIYDAKDHGADFTVALRRVPGFPSYPNGKPENKAGFDGRIGGLAVYDRALTKGEISNLYNLTLGNLN